MVGTANLIISSVCLPSREDLLIDVNFELFHVKSGAYFQ